MQRVFLYVGVAFLLGLAQKFFLDRLLLYGAAPDALIIWAVFIARREGQSVGTTAGFLIGLMMDLLHGTLGSNALSKTVSGFSAGFFRESDKPSAQSEFLFATAIASLSGSVAFNLVSYGFTLVWWQYPLTAASSLGFNLVLGYMAYTLVLRKFEQDRN